MYDSQLSFVLSTIHNSFWSTELYQKEGKAQSHEATTFVHNISKMGFGEGPNGKPGNITFIWDEPKCSVAGFEFLFFFWFFCVFLTNWFVLDQKKNKQTGLWCNREGLGFCHDGFESSICFQLVKNPLPFVSLLSLKSSCMKKKIVQKSVIREFNFHH